jgi:hypothetical protein
VADPNHKRTRSTAAKHASIAAFHLAEGFLLSLTDARDDGRILISVDDGEGTVVMKYMLLNPAERFREVVEQARCVILAGGTMEPVSSQDLFYDSSRLDEISQVLTSSLRRTDIRLHAPAVPSHPVRALLDPLVLACYPEGESAHPSRLVWSTESRVRIQIFQ